MLILSRKLGESIVIDGRITVTITRLEGDVVKVGIQAPADVPVHRQEVYDEIQMGNQEAHAPTAARTPESSSPKRGKSRDSSAGKANAPAEES
jgi:carbon storage regulator